MAFDPQGQRIVSGSGDDETVRIWDAASGVCLKVIRKRRTVRIWDAAFGMLLKFIRESGDEPPIAAGATVLPWRNRVQGLMEIQDPLSERAIQRRGDVLAIVAGAARLPWRALVRGLETVIETAASGEAVAWYPAALESIITHPSGRVWAGSVASHLHLIRLEGEVVSQESCMGAVKRLSTGRLASPG